MRVILCDTYEEMSKNAAKLVASQIYLKPDCVLGLATGSTPIGTYEELVQLYKAGEIDFKDVVTFNLDEYYPISPENPQSYHYFMYENFFNHIDIQKKNIHILDGLTKDYEKECLGYERKIKDMGGIHLFIGGVGEDGHIAFNEPFSSLSSRTRVKTLTESTIKANSRFFDYDLSKVPTQALTVGVGTIMDAEEVMILATGKNKAQALKHSIEDGISHVWTLSELQRHQHGIIVCDKDAASDLSEPTVKYFLEIQSKIPG